MQSAWIRTVGFFAVAALLAAACSVEDDGVSRDGEPGARTLNGIPATGGAGSVSASSSAISSSGAGGVRATTASSSVSSSSTGGGASSSSSSASSSSTGGGGASSSSVGVGGAMITGAGGSTSSSVTMNLPDGSSCFAAGDCASNNCVDGVCCNTPCTGTCVACTAAQKGSGNDGVCGPVQAGDDPDNECDPQPICGETGVCSGFGSCELAPATTSCATCAGVEGYVYPSLCNGVGTCAQPQPVSCGFYQCMSAACLTSCGSDADCVSAAYCNAGVCQQKQNQGTTCSTASACKSGYCADGVCCDGDCTGSCMACTAAKKGIGNDGVCGNITAATDPDNECVDPTTPCEGSGFCNGNGACGPPKAANFPCGAGACSVGIATDPSLCDGSGTCVQGASHACVSVCLGTVCKTACTQDVECPATEFCMAPNCAPKKPVGAACSGASQCAVGFCVDGVCCDSACSSGPCEVCVQSKGASSDGTCTLLNGPAPAGKCGDGAACTDDVCNGGTCANPAKACPAAENCMVAGTCDPASGMCGAPTALLCPTAGTCSVAGACDPTTGLCAAPSPVTCKAASDACHIAPTCDANTGTCGAETPKICPTDGLAVCETRVCDVTAQGACFVRSRLDGAPCMASGHAGLCVAGSCFTVTGSAGDGGAGGTIAASSNATSASAATGGGGDDGGGGSGGFHFVGGACNIVNAEESRLEWLLVGLLVAARRRPRRAAQTSLRGSRDA